VSFRHGTNVEFNSPGFVPGNPTSPSLPTDQIPPIDAYNLETLNNKSRDFSNPMYDAVQSGTTDSNMGKFLIFFKLM
jgi:low density lipoprotein-related protein 2